MSTDHRPPPPAYPKIDEEVQIMTRFLLLWTLCLLSALPGCGDSGASHTGSDADADADSDADSDADADADTDADSDGDSDADADADTDADSDGDSDADSDADTDADTDVDVGCPVHVDGSLSDYAGHDGSTWALALAEVQDGLDAAEIGAADSDGSGSCDVWVRAGTYTPTEDASGSTVPADPRAKTFLLKANVGLYGGFDGTETAIGDRDVAANTTVLSGDIGTASDSDNCYHVVTGADDAVLDGFTISGGNADGSNPDDYGGGMYNDYASPLVAGCVFSGNAAATSGGGMYNSYSTSPMIEDCSFADNAAAVSGGGMYNFFSAPTVRRCSFTGNSAQSGGAMGNADNATAFVASSTFSGNEATDNGGAVYNNYAGPWLVGCAFWSNAAAYGGAIYDYDTASPSVRSCTFARNTAGSGADVYNTDDSYPYFANNILWSGSPPMANALSSTPTITYSDVRGGCAAIASASCGAGNLAASPLFADTDEPDLRLQSTSPCIDTGDLAALPLDSADLDDDADTSEQIPVDLGDDPRVADGPDSDTTPGIDMGAYEY
jgi:hypothetical protein